MIGIIGGSGFYELLKNPKPAISERALRYGNPSAVPEVDLIAGRKVAFLPRHGKAHQFPPHLVPYRANMYALHKLGCKYVIGPCAVGSLRLEYAPGHFVVPDQIVDRTWGRESTFNEFGGFTVPYMTSTKVEHLSCVEPYSQELRRHILKASKQTDTVVHDGGVVCVIQGPRFSTQAESVWYQTQGWDLLNMTQAPEAFLAAELGMQYASIAVVTDYDYGLDVTDVEPVTYEAVIKQFEQSIDSLKSLIIETIKILPY